MMRTMLKSKIHRATVTQADLHYVGSVTVDEDLLDAADLLPGEQVAIVDVTNGARLETYVIPGERGSGVIGINGAAAHLVHPGDLVILISYGVDGRRRGARATCRGWSTSTPPTGSSSWAPTRRRRRPGVLGLVRGDIDRRLSACCSRSTSATARPSSPPSTATSRVGCWRVTTAARATADELRFLWRGLLRDTEVTGVGRLLHRARAAAGAARAAGLPRRARSC